MQCIARLGAGERDFDSMCSYSLAVNWNVF